MNISIDLMNISSHSFVLDPHQWHQNIIKQIHSQKQIINNLYNDKHSLIETKLLLLKGIKQTLKIKLTQVTQQAEQISTQNTQNISLTTLTSEKPYIAISNNSLKQVNNIQMNSMKKMQQIINIKNSMRKEKKKEFMLKSKHIQKDNSIQTVIIPNTKMISSVLLDSSMNQEQGIKNNKTNINIRQTLENSHLNNKSYKINQSSIKTSTKHYQSIAKAQYELIYKQQICQLLQPLIKQVRTIHSKNTFLIKTLKYGYKNQQELNIWLREIKLAYLSMQVNQQCQSLKISLEKSSSSGDKKQSQTTATPKQKQYIENPYQNKIDKIKDSSIKKNLMNNKTSVSFSQVSRQSPKNSQNQSRIFTNFNSNSIKNSQSKLFQNKSYCQIEKKEKQNDKFEQNNEGKSKKLQNSLNLNNNFLSKKSVHLSNLQNNEQNMDQKDMSNKSRLIENSSQYWRSYRIIQRSSFSNKSSQKLPQIIPNYYCQETQQKSNEFVQQQLQNQKCQQKIIEIKNQQNNSESQDKMVQEDKNEDEPDQQMQEWQIKLLQHRRLQNQHKINNPLSQNIIRQQPNFSKKIQNHSKNMNEIIPTFQSVRIQQSNNIQFKENTFSNNKLSNKQQNPLLHFTNPFVVQQSNKQNSSIKFNSSYEQSQSSKLFGNNVKNSSSSFSSQQSGSISSSSQIKGKKLVSPLFQSPSSSLFKSQSNSSSIIIQNGLSKKEVPNPFAPRQDKKSMFNPFQSLSKSNSITFNQTNVKNPFETPKENNQNVANIFGRKQQSSSSIPNCFQQQSSMNPFDNNLSLRKEKNPFENLKGSQIFNPFSGDRKPAIPF